VDDEVLVIAVPIPIHSCFDSCHLGIEGCLSGSEGARALGDNGA